MKLEGQVARGLCEADGGDPDCLIRGVPNWQTKLLQARAVIPVVALGLLDEMPDEIGIFRILRDSKARSNPERAAALAAYFDEWKARLRNLTDRGSEG